MENGWFNNMERLRNLEREIRVSLEKNPNTGKVLELFGPTVEFLTSPQDAQSDFCVLKYTIPPGISVPLHCHADTEDFLVISGEVEGLRQDNEEYRMLEPLLTIKN